jgi:anionic cell wall polymer biosynthesis LytR-Cps2A-Psr (LCP) family protein
MSSKKRFRKRSNWYIYLLTFMVMSMIVIFVVYNIWPILFPQRQDSTTAGGSSWDFVPDASYNATFLLMLSENKGAVPDYYMLLNYRPSDEAIVLVPLKPNLFAEFGNLRGTLNDHYSDGGARAVMFAIQNSLQVSTDHYIKFCKNSFIGFFDEAGNTPVNIPHELQYGTLRFLVGTFELSGEDLYNYITFPEYDQGEDYRFMLHGLAIHNFINRNSNNLTNTQIQTLFTRILNTTDTSLEFLDFVNNQRAYLYTSRNSFSIADYYVPIGSTDDNGIFTIADTAAATIRDRFGLN